MPFIEDPNTGQFTIQSYTPGALRVNDQLYHHSLILTPNRLIEHWGPENFSALNTEYLTALILDNPEVILLGTGEMQHFPPLAILSSFMEKNIGYEIMDTAAACRTYNLLIAEGRNVVAGLIL